MGAHSPLRDLPSVHEVLEELRLSGRVYPHTLAVAETRKALDRARQSLKGGEELRSSIAGTVEAALTAWAAPSYRHVINATGVVLHTNLGRAPLPNFEPIAGYGNLEYNLTTGQRGKRDIHTGKLLEAILGRPAIAVNNGAAALFLILNEFAAGGEVIISRGELIEIGDGFRIPEIMQRSGAVLREVGTTNRTTARDYREAINENTRLLLRVHPSNFRITGFTARPELRELTELGVPLYEDLGSGCLVDLRPYGIEEPLVQESLAAGANLVSFSGDKLLGGPQAGIIAGDADMIARVRQNPLYRALRLDKLFYQAMEVTLRHILFDELDCVPALRMIRMTAAEIRTRAEALLRKIPKPLEIEAGESVIGGGSTPDRSLPTWLIVSTKVTAAALRANNPPVIARVEHDRVLIDLRTVLPEEEDALVQALS